jgi:dienelactone hydrolase
MHRKEWKMPRFIKFLLRIIVAVMILYAGLSILGAVLVMSIPRVPVESSPASVGLAYSDVSFPARNTDIILKGWYLQGQGDQTVLIVHGGFQNRVDNVVDTLDLTRSLVDKGYNVLLFDLRGRGASQGKGLNMLTNESDIGGAVDYLKSRGILTENIGILGFCSGAATTAIFAGQENIGAIVLDGCFTTARTMVLAQAATRRIPHFLVDFFYPGLSFSVKTCYGSVPIDPINIMPQIKCPILFIHEENDNLNTSQETDQLLHASINPANKIWEISSALHSEGYKTHPTQYIDKVDSFLKAQLGTP